MSRALRDRHGFSVIEVSIASALMVLLSFLISSAWIGLARPLIQTVHRCRIAQESTLAVASLSYDLGGYLPDGPGPTGGKQQYRLVGRSQPGGDELWLCFDGGAVPNGQADWASPDIVVVYQVIDDALVRSISGADADFVAARHVESLELVDLGEELEITLTFAYRGISQTYTFLAKNP